MPVSLLLAFLLASIGTHRKPGWPSDFVVNQPGSSTSWKNGSPYPISWTLGLEDGFDTFDIEMTRLSRVGIYFIAKQCKSSFILAPLT